MINKYIYIENRHGGDEIIFCFYIPTLGSQKFTECKIFQKRSEIPAEYPRILAVVLCYIINESGIYCDIELCKKIADDKESVIEYAKEFSAKVFLPHLRDTVGAQFKLGFDIVYNIL